MTSTEPTFTQRALVFVAMTGGASAARVAEAIGVSHPTAATMLARLYWRGYINRTKDGACFIYTPKS